MDTNKFTNKFTLISSEQRVLKKASGLRLEGASNLCPVAFETVSGICLIDSTDSTVLTVVDLVATAVTFIENN